MDELNPEQVTTLRAALLRRREQLEALLRSSAAGAKPVDLGEPIGRVSRIDAIQQQKMTQANRGNSEAELRRISTALADMDTGDYGYCRVCEEPIAFARLQARPDTRICIGCQSKREQA